jgi:hypothetical protein
VEAIPLRWGFDDIGFQWPAPRHQASLTRHPKGGALMQELGFNFWLMWYPDAAGKWSYERKCEFIRTVDAWCAEHDVQWTLNMLSTVWNTSPERCIDPLGYDWFCRPDGRRFYLFPEEILGELGRCQNLVGLMYDEAEHHQNNANYVAGGLDRPSIFDPAGFTLEQAADAHTAAVAAVVDHHARYGLELYTEHVTPVMFHTFARGGVTAGTKVLKESWSPLAIACALGASIQYDTPLWITPDLWGFYGYPSHSPEQYRSALLLAYHIGADCIYTESLCHGPTPGAPYQFHSLAEVTKDDYQLTPYGEVAKQFIHQYVPAHPRVFSRRTLRPRTVIIRQEDGCYGQRVINTPHLPDRLFGSQQWRSTPATEAWMAAWHLLTRGVVPKDHIYRLWSDAENSTQVLCPLDGVVVYDQHVGLELLCEAEVIFLTGVGVSETTRQAVAECVRRGAVCVARPALAPEAVRDGVDADGVCGEGRGRWILTEDFLSSVVRASVSHVIPTESMVRYRFGKQEIIWRPVAGNLDRLAVEVRTVE